MPTGIDETATEEHLIQDLRHVLKSVGAQILPCNLYI